jgi:L-threonylcarbamoyladenylate synthase
MSSERIDEEVEKALNSIKKGHVILFPTDTLWGLTCDITNGAAIERLKKIRKDKAQGKMVLAVNSIDMLKDYAMSIHPRIETLLLYHEKPLSVIYDAHPDIQEHLVSEEKTIAIRVVKDEFSKRLIYGLGQAIISTSASKVGSKELPKSYEDVSDHIKNEVDHIVDLKSMDMIGMPSIIARYNHKGDLEFLRK